MARVEACKVILLTSESFARSFTGKQLSIYKTRDPRLSKAVSAPFLGPMRSHQP